MHYYGILMFIFLMITVETSRKVHLSPFASWNQTGITVAGSSNGSSGSSSSQLSNPLGLAITDDDVLYIGDTNSHRIVVVHPNSDQENFIIGSGPGSNLNQFNRLHDLLILNKSLYVLDTYNYRMLKMSLNGSNSTSILNYNNSFVMKYFYIHNDTTIFLSDCENHQVLFVSLLVSPSRYTRVAGNAIQGSANDQLKKPYGIFLNDDGALYIADRYNHRIMRWFVGDKSGVRVAGDGTPGSASTQLDGPISVVLDTNDYMYITDGNNNRITRWAFNSTYGVCIAACTGMSGTASNQLNGPHSLIFDSNGSLYVSEWAGHRVQKFQILDHLVISYKQSNISLVAQWNQIAITFVTTLDFNGKLIGIFVNNSNLIDPDTSKEAKILLRNKNHSSRTNNTSVTLINARHLFVAIDGNIYADEGIFNHGPPKWSLNQTECTATFIDIKNAFYCSFAYEHRIVKRLPNPSLPGSVFKHGNGTNGSASNQLHWPHGIFVDIRLNLYVADSGNHRIQRFQPNKSEAETVAGNTSLGTYGLNFPTGIVVDIHEHLFIADCHNNRVIRSENKGFQCIVGCHDQRNSSWTQLHRPYTLWFDTDGHMFVLNEEKNEIQKLLLSSNVTATSFFTPLICWNPQQFGLYCNDSYDFCSIIKPCRNNGICHNTNDKQKFRCQCSDHFNGTHCELHSRACQPYNCFGRGKCNETSSTCSCHPGWQGQHCEMKIDYCHDVTCHDHGVCRSLSDRYVCECFGDHFYGNHCEYTAKKIIIKGIICKSVGYIAILALISVAMFVIIMDILKYCFGIDPVERERKKFRQEKQAKKRKRKPVIQRFVYINAPSTTEITADQPISTVADTSV